MSKFNELINGEKPVLVDFFAEWCAPCKATAPIIKQIAEQMSGKVVVLKVDVDKNQAVARQLNIQGVPTLVIYKKGNIVFRRAGVTPAHELIKELEKHL
jgi:thioredoxin 1